MTPSKSQYEARRWTWSTWRWQKRNVIFWTCVYTTLFRYVWYTSYIYFLKVVISTNSTISSLPFTNVKWHSDPWPTVTSQPIRLSNNLITFIPSLTFPELWVVSMEHLQRVWHASRERLSFWTPGCIPLFGTCLCSNCWDQIPRICHVFYSTFHLEYPLVLSRFSLDIILISTYFCYIIFIIYALRVSIFMTSPLGVGCWFVVYIKIFIYKILNVCHFDYTAVAGSGKVWPVNQVNHTSFGGRSNSNWLS